VRLPADLAGPYARSVADVAAAIERRLGPRVVANRLTTAGGGLEPWTAARGRLDHAFGMFGPPRAGAVLVRSDVRDCYGAIGRRAVAGALGEMASARRVGRVLAALDRIRDRGAAGLPVGPAASAIVANAVLATGDEAIARTGVAHIRWVDDVLLIAPSRHEARAAFEAWRRALAAVGLEINLAKTELDLDPAALPRWAGSGWDGSAWAGPPAVR
jgi:Reverse transcriptase (RNA-dependent DNA polymerase)